MHRVEGAAEDEDRGHAQPVVGVRELGVADQDGVAFAAPCRGERSIDARGAQLALQAGNRLVVLEVDTADHPLDKLANHAEPVAPRERRRW